MRHLEMSYNSAAKKVIEKTIEKDNDFKARMDVICLAMQSISALNDEDEPQTFRDAWNHPNKNDRIRWEEATEKN